MKDPIKGHILRKMRTKANLTTRELAQVAGVKTRKTYENWEAGRSQPSVNQFMCVMIACGFTIIDVLAMTD